MYKNPLNYKKKMSYYPTTDINMYDPKRDYVRHQEEYREAIDRVTSHGLFINGPEVTELEKQLADFVKVKHCIGVANGTDALLVSLMALNIKAGDEVITVAHTWISTAEVISLLGAIPVFVDIENDTYNLDISLLESKMTSKTKAIMPVSIYGQMPDYSKINEIAERYNIPVIEDGAQSFGAMNHQGESCGVTTIGCTSFFPSKPLGCWGDGGAVFTNDDDLAMKIRAIKNHGCLKRFEHKWIGLNARLDTLQAAVLLVKMKYFRSALVSRDRVAEAYTSGFTSSLKKLIADSKVKLPIVEGLNRHAWAQYTILLENQEIRDQMVERLKENKIRVAIFYPAPLHLQECFKYLNYKEGDLPITEDVANRIINLPCYTELNIDEQDYIIEIFSHELLKQYN